MLVKRYITHVPRGVWRLSQRAGSGCNTIREEDGSLSQWEHRRWANQYVRSILLNEWEEQAHTVSHPLRHKVKDLPSEGLLERWPIME